MILTVSGELLWVFAGVVLGFGVQLCYDAGGTMVWIGLKITMRLRNRKLSEDDQKMFESAGKLVAGAILVLVLYFLLFR